METCAGRTVAENLIPTMTEADLYLEYKGVYMPKLLHTPESLQRYEEHTFRPDDIVTITYPKSGEFKVLLHQLWMPAQQGFSSGDIVYSKYEIR